MSKNSTLTHQMNEIAGCLSVSRDVNDLLTGSDRCAEVGSQPKAEPIFGFVLWKTETLTTVKRLTQGYVWNWVFLANWIILVRSTLYW